MMNSAFDQEQRLSKTWGENRAGMPSPPGFRCPPPGRAGLRPPRFWTVSNAKVERYANICRPMDVVGN